MCLNARILTDVIFDPKVNNVNVENSTVDRTVELIQSKKKLVLLVEKKALQQVMVRFSSFLDCHVYLEKRNERLQQYMNEITY